MGGLTEMSGSEILMIATATAAFILYLKANLRTPRLHGLERKTARRTPLRG